MRVLKIFKEYGVNIFNKFDSEQKYDAILLAVAHDEFKTFDFEKHYNASAIVFDAKAVVDRRWVDGRL